jgi:nitroreductase
VPSAEIGKVDTMSSPFPGEPTTDHRALVWPLLRARQVREFTAQPPSAAQLDAILEVARWTGSSKNTQPWRFILIRDVSVIREIANAGMTLTRSLQSATAAIAIVLPVNPDQATSLAFDEGRAAERILIAAGMIGLAGAIAWLKGPARPVASGLLGLPPDRMIRTIMALGHPTESALAPKRPPGTARLPRAELVFEERWPAD